jgi:hypothetical protein
MPQHPIPSPSLIAVQTCALFIAAIVVACACQKRAAAPAIATMSDNSSLGARFDAAMQISSSASRDAALRQVATDAAQVRDAQMARRAVSSIVTTSVREAAAEQAALRFAKAGLHREAMDLAKQISSVEVRDRTLSAIAQGAPAAAPRPAQPDSSQ